jgi:hypothetical protein
MTTIWLLQVHNEWPIFGWVYNFCVKPGFDSNVGIYFSLHPHCIVNQIFLRCSLGDMKSVKYLAIGNLDLYSLSRNDSHMQSGSNGHRNVYTYINYILLS